MKVLSGREFARLIELVRLSVPIHGNKPLKIGLLRHRAKLAGISDDELS